MTQVRVICHRAVCCVFAFLFKERYFQYSVGGHIVMQKETTIICAYIVMSAGCSHPILDTYYNVSMWMQLEGFPRSIPASEFH